MDYIRGIVDELHIPKMEINIASKMPLLNIRTFQKLWKILQLLP